MSVRSSFAPGYPSICYTITVARISMRTVEWKQKHRLVISVEELHTRLVRGKSKRIERGILA